MKTILVDAVDTFVIEGEGIFQPMLDLLEQYPNRQLHEVFMITITKQEMNKVLTGTNNTIP